MKRISIPAQDIGYFRLLLDLALLNFSSVQLSGTESDDETEEDGGSDDFYVNQLPALKPER